MRLLLATIIFLLPASAAAKELTRAEGYQLIWDSIRRPAYETKYVTPYKDLPATHPSYLTITYGKRRKILDDVDYFFPADPLTLKTAVLWLFRTRNVDEIDKVQPADLTRLLTKYPLTDPILKGVISSKQQLFELIKKLDRLLLEEVHLVSFYADDFHGNGTAFGETFDMHAITAAHRSLPHNTLVQVTNIANGKSVTVRINDRGPYVHGRDLDLSLAAFEAISPLSKGIIKARFRRLGDKDLVDECRSQPTRYHRRITRAVRFHRGLPHHLKLGQTLWLGSSSHFVVRGITYPDGNFVRFQDFVLPDERFQFKPAVAGEYKLLVGTITGRRRELTMKVQKCQ